MKKIWVENYPKGVVSAISATNQSLLELFDSSFAKFAQDDFITNMGVTYTYAQIDEVSKFVAAWIQGLGLKQGSIIAVMMPNVNQYLPIVIGALRAGMVITLVNPLYTARELRYQLNDSDAKAIFILTPFCAVLEKIINDTNVETVITSDIGTMDEKRYVRILDRKKDLIIVSGFNVYPNEVESVIEGHPKIAECSVVGVDDELQGQAVKVLVVKADLSLTKEEVLQFCKEDLTGYKCPRHVKFIDELPKSTVGKILRHELRKQAAEA